MEECCNKETTCCKEPTLQAQLAEKIAAHNEAESLRAEQAALSFDPVKAIAELSINVVKLQTSVNDMANNIGKEFTAFVNMVMKEFSVMDARIKALEPTMPANATPTNINGECSQQTASMI